MSHEFSSELNLLTDGQSQPRQEHNVNIKRMLRLRLPLMIAVFLLLAIPALLTAWFAVPIEYEATAVIRAAANAPSVLDGARDGGRGSYSQFVATQVGMIEGAAILNRVLTEPEIQQLAWLQEAEDPLHELMSAVSARTRGGSELITIRATAPDRQSALTVVSNVKEHYMDYALGEERTVGGERLRTLYDEQADLRNEWEGQMQRIRRARQELNLPIMEGMGGVYGSFQESYHQGLSMAEADLTEAENSVQQLERLVERIEALQEQRGSNPSQPIYELNIEERAANDSRVQRMRGELIALEADIAILRERYSDTAPQLNAKVRDKEAMERELSRVEQAARAEALENMLAKTKADLTMAQRDLESAEQRKERFAGLIEEHRQDEVDRSRAWSEIREMEQAADRTQRRIQRVSDEIYQINVESKAPARISEAAAPTAPQRPSYGRRYQLMLLGVMFAGGVSVGVGLWRELADQQVRTRQDVSAVTSLPVLASIPHVQEDRLPADVIPALLTAEHPDSTTSDEYRRILSRIIYPPEGSAELNTCLVVSPSRSDGKTSLACNVALTLAQANRRVLLIDISTRRPSVEYTFGMDPAEGLSDVLCGDITAENAVRPTDYPNLWALGPGTRSKELVGKLASREAVEFLEQTEEVYDHIIIDSPPCLLMSDAKLVAPLADGVIMVVGAGVSSLGMLRRAINDMHGVGASLVGIVLNGIRPHRGGYLRHNVRLYYDYPDDHKALSSNGNGKNQKPSSNYREEVATPVLLIDERAPGGDWDPEEADDDRGTWRPDE